jgi:hypothetical protein
VLVLSLALFLIACGADRQESKRPELRGTSPLIGFFQKAEQRFGVPSEILATIAYAQTRLSPPPATDEHVDHRHSRREIGIMAIGTAGLTTVEAAALLSGEPADQIESHSLSNILGAAALLKSAHDARAGENWLTAVEAYGGRKLRSEVRRLVERGWKGSDDANASVELVPTSDIATTFEELGYPESLWEAAYSGNYKNASRTAADIEYIIIHTAEGSYSGTISWFQDPASSVSSHYVVRSSDGEVTQMVDDADIAYHDGCFNTNTIGIEHEAYMSQPAKWFTPEMYASSAALTSWLCDQYGIPKDRQHIMGHGEAPDCSDHTDPGSGWDWNHYMQLVTSADGTGGNGGGSGGDGGGGGGIGGGPPDPASPGAIESVTCDAIIGWAHDATVPDVAVAVELTFDGPIVDAADGAVAADLHRNDLCASVGCEHGFQLAPPYSLFDGESHFVFAYANDVEEGNNVELPGSPLTMSCTPPAITGIKRALPNAATQIEWRLDSFWHELLTDDATIETLPSGTALPSQPVLVRADDGTPAIWLLDGDTRRSVPQPSGMINWRFDAAAVETRPAAELYAMTQGVPLRARPMLVRTSYDEVFLIDDGTGEVGQPGLPEPEDNPPTGNSPSDDDDSSQGACAARIAGGADTTTHAAWLLGLFGSVLLARRRRRH